MTEDHTSSGTKQDRVGGTGADLLAWALAAHGIHRVFTTSSPTLEGLLLKLEGVAEGTIEVFRAREEIAATAMADAFTRRSQQVCVILTAGGARAVSQLSAITNAWADKTPLLSISLCHDVGPDANKGIDRRRFDQTDVFRAVTHWRGRIERVEDIPQVIAAALAAALTGKMGPSHIDIPHRLLDEPVDIAPSISPHAAPVSPLMALPPRVRADEEAINKAMHLLRQAERPLCVCGAGVARSGAEPEIAELLRKMVIPATTSMAGIGAVSASHDCFIGGPSYAGGEVFHSAIKRADCVLAIGFAFGGLEGFGRPPMWADSIQFIHIDIDPLQIGLNTSPSVAIQADAKTAVSQMLAKLDAAHDESTPARRAWRDKLLAMRRIREARNLRHAYGTWNKVHPGRLAHEVAMKMVEDDLLLVLDGGNTPLYAAIYAGEIKPMQVFFPFGMAALGAGVPASIGVQLASPDRRVLLFTGDASMLYNVQELETIARLQLPITIVVNNDSAWNMIRCTQSFFEACRYINSDLPDVDYAEIARGFGFAAETITRAEDFVPAYMKTREAKGPVLLNVITDKTDFPDSLISFGLVELDGVQQSLRKMALGQWRMLRDGWRRLVYRVAYLKNAFLKNLFR